MDIDQLRELTNKNPILKAALYPAVVTGRSFLKKKYSWQKEIINNLGEMLVGDPVIKVDEFKGVFAVDPCSDLFSRILIQKYYEPKLVKFCTRYLDPNRDVIDVGANVGFYTVMFAKSIAQRKVLSIEPTKNALQRLRKNIELNGVIDKVDVFEGVASNRNGTVEIKTIKGKEEYSSLGEMEHPSIANEKWVSEKVISTTLDELVERKSLDPGFLKIDVEGAEHLVFQGAQKILGEKRPIILSEMSEFLLRKNGSSAKEVIDLIKAHEYDLFDPLDLSTQPEAKDFGDILCFPKEMKVRMDAQ
jgi:FkbM family methyltransferase